MKLENILHVDAPLEVVWDVTVDVERWPEWTPTVESVRRVDWGPLDVGNTARLKLPRLPETTWTVTALVDRERFAWESRVRGIRMVAVHEMRGTDRGTESLISIEMTGLVALLLSPLMWVSARGLLEQENAGLKGRCEEIARLSPQS